MGSVSVTTTLVALEGPLFVTTSVYVSRPPAVTGSVESVFVIVRSTCACTCVGSVSRLFSVLVSVSLPATVASFVIVPRVAGSTVTRIVTVAVAPLANGPTLAVTVLPDRVDRALRGRGRLVGDPRRQRVDRRHAGGGGRAVVDDRKGVRQLPAGDHRIGRIGFDDRQVDRGWMVVET